MPTTKAILRHVRVETPRTNHERPCAAHRKGRRPTSSWPVTRTWSSWKMIRRSDTARGRPPRSSTSRNRTSTHCASSSVFDIDGPPDPF